MTLGRKTGLYAAPSPEAARVTGGASAGLVGYGFRCWMHGLRSGETRDLERVWSLYCGALGVNPARTAVDQLDQWVRAIAAGARRPIRIGAPDAPRLTGDERLAVGLVAAGQHHVCPAMRACAIALMETIAVDHVVEHARSLALTLRACGHELPSGLLDISASIAPAPPGTLLN